MKTLLLSPQELKQDILAYARSLGFSRAGVTSADPLEREGDVLLSWIGQGQAGEMAYLTRNARSRARPADQLPGAKSVIALAASYFYPSKAPAPVGHKQLSKGRIARYAWGREYHGILRKRLDSLVRYIGALVPDARCKTFVDTGPLLERPLAQRAGLGFIGKNTLLITRGQGSWVFLSMIATTLELPIDKPDDRGCGSCTLCLEACPTQAITAPYQLDARRCIAYLTIELKNDIPQELRSQTCDWLFGCDICQDVCPHNVRTPTSSLQEFDPSQGAGTDVDLADVLKIRTDAEFEKRFCGTSLKRAQRHGLLRNACLAAANTGRFDLIPCLKELADKDPHPVVRDHAAWAVSQLESK